MRLLGEEVDENGFPLDGYDYYQHLKEMGASLASMAVPPSHVVP